MVGPFTRHAIMVHPAKGATKIGRGGAGRLRHRAGRWHAELRRGGDPPGGRFQGFGRIGEGSCGAKKAVEELARREEETVHYHSHIRGTIGMGNEIEIGERVEEGDFSLPQTPDFQPTGCG